MTVNKLRMVIDYLKHHRDFALLGGAALLLLVALLRPTVQVQRDIYTYLLVVDITQSMNTVDMMVDPRFIATRKRLDDLIHPPVDAPASKLPMLRMTVVGDDVL